MNVQLLIGGVDVGDYLNSVERTEDLCMPGQQWSARLDLNCPETVEPWSTAVIKEDGDTVLTGYVSGVSDQFNASSPYKIVTGVDTWKRATDCWNTETYITGVGDTVGGLIARFLDMAGLSYSLGAYESPDVPVGLMISYQPVSEIVLSLASAANAFIRVNAAGVVLVGDVVNENPGPDIAEGDNLISIDRTLSDYRARNRVMVWSPAGLADIRSDEDWAVVDHTMVYASPYCNNPEMLASRIHADLHNVEDIKQMATVGDSSRRAGQVVDVSSTLVSSTDEVCTKIRSEWNKNVGHRMTITTGERCAIFGAGPSAYDGRDVIVATYGHGVWRCKDIWEDTPHWEPLNTGLRTAYPAYGIPADGGLNCDWFIRDPFECNTRAFLVTEYGIYETRSLEPGYENWIPVLSNQRLYDETGNSGNIHLHYTLNIRSTIARRGRYYILAGVDGDEFGGWYKIVGVTNDHFKTFNLDARHDVDTSNYISKFCPGKQPPPPLYSGLAGELTTGWYLDNTGISSWHHLSPYCEAGKGGLAAWHRNDHGCFVTGTKNNIASYQAGPAIWSGTMWIEDVVSGGTGTLVCKAEDICVTPVTIVTSPFLESVWNECPPFSGVYPNYQHPTTMLVPTFNIYNGWYKQPTIHIPYDQTYTVANGGVHNFRGARNMPSVYYLIPGLWTGGVSGDTGSYPWHSTRGTIYNLPWGGTDCHFLQGSLGTYSPNRNKVYCFNAGKPSRFAVSDDECDTWTEKTSVPIKTSCFSGFPYSSAKVYVGRDPVRDATGVASADDTALLYSSWDRGDTWTDVTGDLWTQTQAMKIGGGDFGGPYYGAHGLVTVAPRYQK